MYFDQQVFLELTATFILEHFFTQSTTTTTIIIIIIIIAVAFLHPIT